MAESTMNDVPLFPLNALVCPRGRIPLRVFETRYLDMVSSCLQRGSGFVIVMLRDGDEVGMGTSQFYQVGTLVDIVDFGQTDQGILDITCEGLYRVNIHSARQRRDGLWVGQIERACEEDFVALPDEYEDLKAVLQALVQHPMVEGLNLEIDYQDGRQVGWRLTELLPLDNDQKQKLFEMNDTLSRLQTLSDQLSAMAS